MKGLVLEAKNNETAILREDGIVVKIKGVYQVGETIQLGEVSSFPSKSRNSKGTINSFLRLAVAAALIIVLSFGGYNYAAVMAETYVTIDDPTDGVSIEYVLNRLNKVVSINAYNKAGEDVKAIIEKDVKGLSISEALDVYNKASSDSSSPKVYSVTSKSEKKGQSISDELKKKVDSENIASGNNSASSMVITGTIADRDEALSQGMGTGQYLIVKEDVSITEENPGATYENDIPGGTISPENQESSTSEEIEITEEGTEVQQESGDNAENQSAEPEENSDQNEAPNSVEGEGSVEEGESGSTESTDESQGTDEASSSSTEESAEEAESSENASDSQQSDNQETSEGSSSSEGSSTEVSSSEESTISDSTNESVDAETSTQGN